MAVLAVAALAVLQARLGAQPLKRIRLQARDRRCRGERCELCHRGHARRVELLALTAGDAGHETQVVGGRPFSLTALPPAAQAAGAAGLAVGFLRHGVNEGLESRARARQVVLEIPSGQEHRLAGAECHVQALGCTSLHAGEQVRIDTELHEMLRLGRVRELGVEGLVVVIAKA